MNEKPEMPPAKLSGLARTRLSVPVASRKTTFWVA
jgi:hypothetical protein